MYLLNKIKRNLAIVGLAISALLFGVSVAVPYDGLLIFGILRMMLSITLLGIAFGFTFVHVKKQERIALRRNFYLALVRGMAGSKDRVYAIKPDRHVSIVDLGTQFRVEVIDTQLRRAIVYVVGQDAVDLYGKYFVDPDMTHLHASDPVAAALIPETRHEIEDDMDNMQELVRSIQAHLVV